MDVNYSFTDAAEVQPVVFEQIWGEKPGGGMVANPSYNIKPGTAVGFDSGALKPIKAYRLVSAVAIADTEIEIAKGSGVVVGDPIAHGTKAVACTEVDTTTYADKDVVTVTMGVDIDNGTVLYQAVSASASSAAPVYAPSYLVGGFVYAGKGDQAVKLVNGANVRKETVEASPEVLALLTNINAV